MIKLHLKLLGAFNATLSGQEIPLTGAEHVNVRALLSYLVIENLQPHPRERLASMFWPDQPDRAALHSLRQSVAVLRRLLGENGRAGASKGDRTDPPFLIVTEDTIQFNPDSDYHLDISSFESHLDAALTHYRACPHTNLLNPHLLKKALALFQGPLLNEFPPHDSVKFNQWLIPKRENLNVKATEGLELLMAYHERRGEYKLARQAGRRLIELAPWEENAHRLVMRTLAFEGKWSSVEDQYDACCSILTEDLSVNPAPETVQLFEDIQRSAAKDERFSPDRPRAFHNLPTSIGPCLGRESELEDLTSVIADPQYRLISLHGPRGIGKTHLVLEAAEEQIGLFKDGVFYVSLVETQTRAGLISAIAQAVNFTIPDQGIPEDHLLNYMSDKNVLLILDDFDNHTSEGDLITKLLQSSTSITIILLSRQPIDINTAYLLAVTGLAIPQDESISIEDAQSYGAIRLLIDRASRVQKGLVIDQDQLSAAIQICELVGGTPLGLVLVSGTVWSGSFREIAEGLAGTLDSLISEKAEALQVGYRIRAAFQYSWKKLSKIERVVYQKLSVFHGGFPEKAALEIAGASAAMLQSLEIKSLLWSRSSSGDRYAVHELLRQYAREKLERHASMAESAHSKHASYFSDYLHTIERNLTGSDQAQALEALSQEMDNVIQAWNWSLSNGMRENIDKGLEGLYRYCSLQPRLQEGVEWFDQAIEHCYGESGRSKLCQRLLSRRGALLNQQGLTSDARSSLMDSLQIVQSNGNKSEEIFALIELASIAHKESSYEEAKKIAQESLSISREVEHLWGITASLHALGLAEYHLGQINEAERFLQEGLSAARRFDIPRYVLRSLDTLGYIDRHKGDYRHAVQKFEQCLELSRDIENQHFLIQYLDNLGAAFLLDGDFSTATSYYKQSLDGYIFSGDVAGQARALGKLGDLALLSGDHVEAERYFERGLNLGYDVQDTGILMAFLIKLGDLSRQRNRGHDAEMYLLEAIQMASREKNLHMLTQALVSIGELYLHLGQIQRAMDCIAYVLRDSASPEHIQEKAQALMDEVDVDLGDCHNHTRAEVLSRLMEGDV